MTVKIVETILKYYPETQAVCLFGTYGTFAERPESDVDIALLLPHNSRIGNLQLAKSDCRFELEELLEKEVDLLNVRKLSTVFQKEVVMNGSLIYSRTRHVVDEFEMLTLSYYQKLNEERAEILEEIQKTRKILS